MNSNTPPASPPTQRVTQILEFLSNAPLQAFTLTDLIQELDMSRATAHAIISTLCESGILIRHPESKTITLGPLLIAIGEAAQLALPDISHAAQELESLSNRLGYSYSISTLVQDHLVVAKSKSVIGTSIPPPPIGYRVPFIPPYGASFIANNPDYENILAQWFERGNYQYSSKDKALFSARVNKIKDNGFGVDCLTNNEVKLRQILVEMDAQQSADDIARLSRQLFEQLRQKDISYTAPKSGQSIHVSELFAPVANKNLSLTLHIHQNLQAADIDKLGTKLKKMCNNLAQ